MKAWQNAVMMLAVGGFVLSLNARGVAPKLDFDEMREVFRLVKTINVLHSSLDEAKYIEYAIGIYRAGQEFDIDPSVLVAIAQQESSFRENLPEGKAGEIGICQIRKAWLSHPDFKALFGHVTIGDLRKPARSFRYAAWILRDLKMTARGSLPFWSYYNATRFINRFKYFMAVNKKLSVVKRYEATLGDPKWFATKEKNPAWATRKISPTNPRVLRTVPRAVPVSYITNESASTRWIPDAPSRIDSPSPIKKLAYQGPGKTSVRGDTQKAPSYIMQAAMDLGISTEWFRDKKTID